MKRNILTIKKIHREVSRAKDLSAPRGITLLYQQNVRPSGSDIERQLCNVTPNIRGDEEKKNKHLPH